MTKLSEKKGGGLIYNPPRMLFDGSTGYFSDTTVTVSGNKVTVFAQVKIPSFTNGGVADERYICHPVAGGFHRGSLIVYASDAATTDWRNKVFFLVRNSSNVTICGLISTQDICDGEVHTIFAQFDGDAGTAVFKVDGADADNTGATSRVAPTTGTISTTSPAMYVGTNSGASRFTSMEIGTFGYDDSASAVWSDYMDQYGNPKQTDFSGWLFGHFAGKMDENEGTAGAMTKNGTITLVDPGECPHIGLPTIGDAENWHIKSAKKAWVNGVEKTGSAYTPAMMQFDGNTGYFSRASVAFSGKKVAAIARFNIPEFSSGDVEQVILAAYGSSGRIRCILTTYANNSTANSGERQNKLAFLVRNASNINICLLLTDIPVCDGTNRSVQASYDGDLGVATLLINATDADDTGFSARTLTTGTPDGGTGTFYVGANSTPGGYFASNLGCVGYDDQYISGGSGFVRSDGSPIYQDPASAWSGSGFGSQPLFYNPHGDMENNLGSAGAMTKNGTIVVGDGGAM